MDEKAKRTSAEQQPAAKPSVLQALTGIVTELTALVNRKPIPPLPSDADVAAIRKARDVFARLNREQQLIWLRRLVIKVAYHETIRVVAAERSDES